MENIKHNFGFYVPEECKQIAITEKLKSKADTKKNAFQKELGEEHIVDMNVMEQLYIKEPFIHGGVNKYLDFIVSPGFFVTSIDPRAEKLIKDYLHDMQFEEILREWIIEALIYGTSFMEMGYDKNKVPVELKNIDPKTMYIRRDDSGEVIGYTQKPAKIGEKPIFFEKDEIACLTINRIGGNAYGYGIIYALAKTTQWRLNAEEDMTMLLGRKANSPIIAKIGNPENPPTEEDINRIGQQMEFLNNKHEWAVDYATELSVLDFGNVGDKFKEAIDIYAREMYYGLQIPQVLMGDGSIPEGLAKVQIEAYQYRIKSLQQEIEKVLETELFRKYLDANGFNNNVHVEFEWGEPSDAERRAEISTLSELLKNPFLNDNFKTQIEIRLGELLGFEKKDIEADEEERENEEQEPQPQVPGQNNPENRPVEHCKCEKINELYYKYHITESRDYELKEWIGFNYGMYLEKIKEFISEYEYNFLQEQDFTAGQISGLKNILSTSFDKGESIQKIAKKIRTELDLKDLETARGTIPAKRRSVVIARTETIRASSEGAINFFQDRGVNKVEWSASFSDRTCDYCAGLHGSTYSIQESHGLLPAHVACRCCFMPVVTLERLKDLVPIEVYNKLLIEKGEEL